MASVMIVERAEMFKTLVVCLHLAVVCLFAFIYVKKRSSIRNALRRTIR